PLTKGKREPAPFEGTPPPGRHVLLGVVTGADDAKNTLEVRVGTVTGTVDLAEAARYNPKGLKASQVADVGKVLRVVVSTNPANDRPRLHLELGPESALVAVDVRSREILALVGSYEAVRAGLDRTSSHRHPGSTFKSFVYSYAVHAHTREWTPATIVETN